MQILTTHFVLVYVKWVWQLLICCVQVSYQLKYVVGPKAVQKPKKALKNNSAEPSCSANYAKAEREFKLQWFKYVCAFSFCGSYLFILY